MACDPTNLAPVGERHVVIGRGRDYADVSPLKGIYSGAPSVAMEVTVEVTRLALWAERAAFSALPPHPARASWTQPALDELILGGRQAECIGLCTEIITEELG